MSSRRLIRRTLIVLAATAAAVYGFVWLDNQYTADQARKEREAQVSETMGEGESAENAETSNGAEGGAGGEGDGGAATPGAED